MLPLVSTLYLCISSLSVTLTHCTDLPVRGSFLLALRDFVLLLLLCVQHGLMSMCLCAVQTSMYRSVWCFYTSVGNLVSEERVLARSFLKFAPSCVLQFLTRSQREP